MLRAKTFVVVGMANLLLSAVAVAAVVLHPASPVLAGLSHLAERFASPGEFLWWSTLGGAFSGYPTGPLGYALWVLGTALFWSVASVFVVALVKGLRARKD